MIRCYSCGSNNDEQNKFCGSCGALLNNPAQGTSYNNPFDSNQKTYNNPFGNTNYSSSYEKTDSSQPSNSYNNPFKDLNTSSSSSTQRGSYTMPPKQSGAKAFQVANSSYDGMSLAGLIISIVSLFTCGLTSILPLILSILGYKSAKEKGKRTTEAVIGIVISSIGLVILLLLSSPSNSISNRSATGNNRSAYQTTSTTGENVKIGKSSDSFIDMDKDEAIDYLQGRGFTNLTIEADADYLYGADYELNTVSNITIDDDSSFSSSTSFSTDMQVIIHYHSAAITTVDDYNSYINENYNDVILRLHNAGFSNIELDTDPDLIIALLHSDGDVESISINGETGFSEGDEYPSDSIIRIIYHTFPDADSSNAESSANTTDSNG